MTCKCISSQPGEVIKTDSNGYCISYRGRIAVPIKIDFFGDRVKRWDNYFHKICESVATKSPCLSRQIGVILVRDNSIVSTGFNGPARGYPHCEGKCPRHAKGYKSGEGLHECPAVHAEANAIANAAKLGVVTQDTTLYMNCIIPCKDCMTHIVNAGIKEVVVDKLELYHTVSEQISYYGKVKIREFSL